MAKSLKNEGSIWCKLNHKNPDWWNDKNGYKFPSIFNDTVELQILKHANGMLDITVIGPLGGSTQFSHVCPEPGPDGVSVVVSWSKPHINLNLNGDTVEIKKGSDSKRRSRLH